MGLKGGLEVTLKGGLRGGLRSHSGGLKLLIYPVFKVLRNGLLRYILYTCPNL